MTASAALPYLDAECLEALRITVEDVVDAIERVIVGQRDGTVWNAPKATIVPPDDRYMMSTMCAADGPGLLAVKSLVLNPGNPAVGLPIMNSLISLVDSRTGEPRAVVDGNWVTAVRTAGLSAVAARRMARPTSAVLAFIGCGVQAHAHLRTFAALYPLTRIQAFGRGTANRDALCDAARALGLEVVASASAEAAVAGADIVVSSVTRSPALQPFLDAGWLAPGAFASMTDLAAPWHADSLAVLDTVVIDDLRQERTMSKPMVDLDRVSGDLTGLVCGDFTGRRGDDARTAFVFRGLGTGDLAVAALAYQRWRAGPAR